MQATVEGSKLHRGSCFGYGVLFKVTCSLPVAEQLFHLHLLHHQLYWP